MEDLAFDSNTKSFSLAIKGKAVHVWIVDKMVGASGWSLLMLSTSWKKILTYLYLFIFFTMLGIDPRVSCMLAKCYVTELHLQPIT
jgi:hypothetical protein